MEHLDSARPSRGFIVPVLIVSTLLGGNTITVGVPEPVILEVKSRSLSAVLSSKSVCHRSDAFFRPSVQLGIRFGVTRVVRFDVDHGASSLIRDIELIGLAKVDFPQVNQHPIRTLHRSFELHASQADFRFRTAYVKI